MRYELKQSHTSGRFNLVRKRLGPYDAKKNISLEKLLKCLENVYRSTWPSSVKIVHIKTGESRYDTIHWVSLSRVIL